MIARNADSDSDAAWDKSALLASPLLEPLHPLIERLGDDRFPGLATLNGLLPSDSHAIRVASGLPLRFVPQAYGRLAFEAQYEPRCYLTGEVQTRASNWHDLYNALVWLAFPRAKAAINLRHYQALTGEAGLAGATSQRGAVRDAATLLDESGVIVAYADDALADLLRGFQWKSLFWDRRFELGREVDFRLFGHGLYEKAQKPYIGLTGQGLLLQVAEDYFAWPPAQRQAHIDERLAGYLSDPALCRDTAELTPVPLLGIPGWFSGNELPDFYDNAAYFRPGRRRKKMEQSIHEAGVPGLPREGSAA